MRVCLNTWGVTRFRDRDGPAIIPRMKTKNGRKAANFISSRATARNKRHRFAIETLLRWYRRGEQVTRRMPVLSTYLGHGNVTGTYWYLSNTPELMAVASHLLETRWKGVVQ